MTDDLSAIEQELGQSSEQLLGQFQTARSRSSLVLSPEGLVTWAKESLALGRCSLPLSLEAAGEYYRVTPEVLDILPFPRFTDWARRGKALCRDSPGLATAYFRASPRVLAMLPERMREVWLEMGPGLYGTTQESMDLASGVLAATPDLLESLSLAKIERFALLLNRLAQTSYDLATGCLRRAPLVMAGLAEEERGPHLAVALALVRLNPRASATCFERGAEALASVAAGERRRFLMQLERIARRSARFALSFLFDCSQALSRIDDGLHSRLLDWADALLAVSTTAGIEFLKNCPAVAAEAGIAGLERWFREGARLLRQSEKAGLAHFRLEFADERALERLSVRVELDQVREVLAMYGHALAGTRVDIRPGDGLAEWSMGSVRPGTPAPDEAAIFLPPWMDRYGSEDENFAWYKVAATHQAGHIEFGTFDFCFEKEAALFDNRRHQLSPADGNGQTDIERFFGLFEDRALSAHIFSMVEDTRIDYLVKRGYAGIRASYQLVQEESLSWRPFLNTLPLREACLEVLIRLSLDMEFPEASPGLIRGLRAASEVLRRVQSQEATVEDSAEAAIRLYDFLSAVPNTPLPEWEWGPTDFGDTQSGTVTTQRIRQDGQDAALEPGTEAEVPYQAPTDVEFRNDLHTETLRLRLDPKDGTDHGAPSPSLPSGDEAHLNSILHGRHAASGPYVTDLPTRALGQGAPSDGQEEEGPVPEADQPALGAILVSEGRSYLYDEWDFRAGCYRQKWCRVRERQLPEASAAFFEDTLARNPSLAARVRRQFEMIAPEHLRKADRLYDGEELNLDAVVRAVVDRKAGSFSDERVYWKRRKVQRDVAAVLLLDMSASTSDAIKSADDGFPDWYLDLIEYQRRPRGLDIRTLTQAPRRVIDVVKESMVLMTSALEAVGDCYGVYGFSGHGREDVEVLVIKGIDEQFSGTVKRRIGSISPLYGTRMGPAIRHATSKLAACGAKTKLLFLVSDGYPQDEGYGRDAGDEEYAVQDTRMAFIEARRSDIIPFCLTVDLAGYDYLRRIGTDIDYEVVNDVESLPERLPALYRRLTS